jgi:site-specific DNA-cytosine methylase
VNIELCSCSGGMAEGFRRAGVRFDLAFDKDPDACASYEANHGHRPIQMDVHDLLRMVRAGWQPTGERVFHVNDRDIKHPTERGVDLLVADPPCTPWSRAGKRAGLDDPRDCLRATADLIRLLRPSAYLIGNVPGLQDSTSWHVVQEVIGGLAAEGYCVVDYASLDAADYGVPQHRVRPFWFGHLDGPCITWPAPTHGAPDAQLSIGGHALAPWVTCRQALQHLPIEELGRPVRLRWNTDQDHRASSPDEPAKALTTNTHSDGALIRTTDGHPLASPEEPSPTIRIGGAGHSAPQVVLFNEKHAPSGLDAPSKTVAAKVLGQGGQLLATHPRHPVSDSDSPSRAIKTNGGRASQGGAVLSVPRIPQRHRVSDANAPAPTVLADTDAIGHSSPKLEWPWDRPCTTIQGDERVGLPGHHDPNVPNSQHGPNAIILSERAAAILQGFPEDWVFAGDTKKARWSQIGQAMPPGLAEAVARAVVAQRSAAGREAA